VTFLLKLEGIPMVLLEFSMSPLDKGESVSKYVAGSLDIIDKSGLDYRVNSMGTVIEGDWDEVFDVVKQCFDKMKKDCNRVITTMKIDYRKDERNRLVTKIESIENKLGKKLKS
ncbi:MAG: MTH1187 family thiamine-binding protein, partial [Candidatus Anammoxibacter sp.]